MLSLVSLAVASSYSEAPVPACDAVVLASYNVNYGLEGDGDTLAAAVATHADVLVVQEVTPLWAGQLADAFAAELPNQLFLPDGRGAGGLAILSRWPVSQHAFIASPIAWFPGWILHVATPHGNLQVLTVHLKPPVDDHGSFVGGAFSTADDRLAEMKAYVSELDPQLPTVVAGDFNERNGPSIAYLASLGYQSALPNTPTWRWDTPVGTIRRQLDHVLISAGMTRRDGAVLDIGKSDHLPLRASVCW